MRFRRKDIGGQARSKYFSYLNNASYNSGTTTGGGSNNFTFEEKWLPAKLNADGSYTVDLARVNFTGLIVGQSDIIAYAASDYDGEDSGAAFLKALNITSPKNDDILVYKDGQWINQEANFGSAGLDLEQLSSYLTENNYITSSALNDYVPKSEVCVYDPYGKIAKVRTDGVMEVGKFLDFHSSAGGSTDYDVRLSVEGDKLYRTGNLILDAGNYNSVLDSQYVTLGTEQIITGKKTFGYEQTDFTKKIFINGESTGFGVLPTLYFHIPGTEWAKFVMSTDGSLSLVSGGATDWGWGNFKSLTTGYHTIVTPTATVKIGSQNGGYVHYESSGLKHWFNVGVCTRGDFYAQDSGGNGQLVWHAGNDGHNSGLDADLLDGFHEGNFFRTQRGWIDPSYIYLSNYNPNATGYANYPSGTYLLNNGGDSSIFINFSVDGGSTSAFQLMSGYSDDCNLAYRKTIDSNRVSGPWRQIVTEMNINKFNAGSASKLQTARNIWGQSFDGSGNVSGTFQLDGNNNGCLSIYDGSSFRAIQTWNLKPLVLNPQGNNVGIYTTNPQAKLHVAGDLITNSDYWFQGYDGTLRIYSIPNPGQPAAYESETVVIQTAFDGQDPKTSNYPQNYPERTVLALQPRGGRVGIGTAYASQVLDVNGNILATGDVICYSDARLKSEIKTLNNRGYLTPRTYIKDGKKCIGFIAQEVKEKYPELIQEGEYLSLNYNGLVAVLEAQILELKEEINKLREEVINGK